jgi:ubiquinol-cytochrome c reductase cytochrome c subunit
MKSVHRLLVIASATVVIGVAHAQAPVPAVPAPAPRSTATAPVGDATEGRALYKNIGCYQCHGYEAQGSSVTGPRLGPRPIAYASFLKYVRQPTNQMPPYTTRVVTDAELADIYAFLQALPMPPAVESLVLLK